MKAHQNTANCNLAIQHLQKEEVYFVRSWSISLKKEVFAIHSYHQISKFMDYGNDTSSLQLPSSSYLLISTPIPKSTPIPSAYFPSNCKSNIILRPWSRMHRLIMSKWATKFASWSVHNSINKRQENDLGTRLWLLLLWQFFKCLLLPN